MKTTATHREAHINRLRGWTSRTPRGEPPKPNRCDDSLTLKVAKLPCPANARGGGQRTGNQATRGEAETQARHSIVQGELHFGRRDLGRTCLAAGACSTTTGGETAALLPLTAMCRTPRALTSTNRRGVVRSRNQRGVARTGQERNAEAREALRVMMNAKSPAHARQKHDDKDNRP